MAKKREETGDYQAEIGYQQGYNSKISGLEKFRDFAEANGSLTQKEIAEKWSEQVSDRTIGKAIKKLATPEKKNGSSDLIMLKYTRSLKIKQNKKEMKKKDKNLS